MALTDNVLKFIKKYIKKEYVKKQTQVMKIECEENYINIHSISHKTD